ncbi:hypothetical protein [Pseudonocardia broussonetiae]|uniref:Uncharacterized protein n=1 Tax=Pseudonocardia broussonetiae TaxID=2736640 RepID=A0A6M6JHV5_9PSEU|nr:hypothetical protein [Pseudonocardia broussonetiae]QJY46630.1 hypothetical protein HOP40_13060 [Pseudonocardia broussonetiae]
MRCAREDCRRAALVVVDVGEGLLVVLCADDGVRALVEDRDLPVRALGRRRSRDATVRPRGA